jgi:hypothetical protein
MAHIASWNLELVYASFLNLSLAAISVERNNFGSD